MSPSPQLLDARGFLVDRGAGRGTISSVIGLAWHHTTGSGLPPDADENAERAYILGIESYHLTQGYLVFAYHGIAFASGRAYITGNLDRKRSHVANRNHELVGFVLAGDFSNSSPPPGQLAAAALLRGSFIDAYGQLPERGHRDWALPAYPTACPGAQRNEWIPRIRKEEDRMSSSEYETLSREVAALNTRLSRLEAASGLPGPQPETYTVQAGDSLDAIARGLGLDGWQGLYDANVDVVGSNPSLIQPGMVLRVPR